MSRTRDRRGWRVLALGWLFVSAAQAQVAPSIPTAGGVANENERNQQVIQQQLEPQFSGPPVVGPKAADVMTPPPGGATFVLKKVVFDHSEFISEPELQAAAAPYIGAKVDNAQLQRLLKAVNDIYAERRVITAMAYLPQQDLNTGVLRIAMVEGRLGTTTVKGNDTLPAATVAGAVHQAPGAVVNVPALENDIAWFNKSHVAQVQASLQPGASFGLTDIQLATLEPRSNALQIFTDNQGVESVGQYEVGINFQHYNLLGLDDKFTAYGVLAQGDGNVNLAYNLPFNPWGGRIGASWSDGSIRVFHGAYALLDIHGRSQSGAINLSQPVFVDPTWALLLTGSLTKSTDQSHQVGVLVTDNTTNKGTAGVTLSYASAPLQASISPNYSFAETDYSITSVHQDFQSFNSVQTAVLRLPLELNLSLVGADQWASKKLLAGDQLFQIGGPTTVRGYPSNAVAGYAGYYNQLELHHSLSQIVNGLDAYAFYDNGMVFSTFPSSVTMNSVGGGLSWDTHHYIVAELSFGVPLTRAVNNQGGCAFYYRLTAKFD